MMHVTVCICTFRRPVLLARLLRELEKQATEGLFTYSVVVADNDAQQSAKPTAAEFATRLALVYCVEPERNIAAARNMAVRQAKGDFIAFIDDDEYPVGDWLLRLFKNCTERNVAGVLGPVEPYFEKTPAAWILETNIFSRPRHETGYAMPWTECRTGNLLFRRSILAGMAEPFDRKFGTGGEDVDFFLRMSEQNHVFVWCDEAVAYELVPKERQTRRYILKRAFLRGQVSLKYSKSRVERIAKSLIALPLYGVALPFLAVAGQRFLLRYMIKICDHAGRLLTLCGLEPSNVRAGDVVRKAPLSPSPTAMPSLYR
jgi:succinoglycan biosynthesis protein ExoM